MQVQGFEFKFSLTLPAKASYQTVSKKLPCGSDWAYQKWWGSCVSCLRRSRKATRHRRSEKKYYLQFTSGNGFYLHSSKWFVARWGTDLLNLSLVSPEAGAPWSTAAACGVGRQTRKCSCRKVLGRLGTGCQTKNSYARFVPKQLWSVFLSSHLNKLVHSISCFWGCPKPWGRNTPVLALVSSAVFEEWGQCGFFCKQQPKKQKQEETCRPGNSCDQWAKLMSCSKCEKFCVESMPRAVYDWRNVSLQTEIIYGAGKPWCFYPR